jgi:hypothetical protein
VTASEPPEAASDGETSGEEVQMDDPTKRDTEEPSAALGERAAADATPHEPAEVDTTESTPSLIEIAVFAPIDAAFALLRDPGGAASRGRARVDQALRQARAIGELSIKFGARELRRRTEGAAPAEDAATSRSSKRTAAHPDAGPAPDDVIADYDALSASQIVPMLSGLEPPERARVADYERKSRARQTILRRIDQLDGNGA